MKKKVNNAGFSLVEVILAMAILAILAIPLLNYFVESMKYNARMSQEQHATLLAQETVEDLKSQDQLIAFTTRPDGTSGYQSTYLEGLGYASTSSDASGVSYYGAADAVHKDYDVTITVNADTAENQKLLPQISGIDDTCDVLAKESGQADAALAAMRAARYGENAAIVGRVLPLAEGARPAVRVRTGWGSTRILDMLVGEQLPRIC